MSQAASAVLGALGDAITLSVAGSGAVGIQITGTFVGTLTFEGSLDGLTFVALKLVPINGTTEASTATAPGLWTGAPGGLNIVKVSVTAYTSGKATVWIRNAPSGSRVGSGGGGGGGAVTIADGDDVAEGATTDSAVTGDNTGTVSAKLRGLDKILADVWDSVNHWLKVSIQNATIAVTQSGSWVLSAGSAIVGKVSIDQTTPGTTNGVQVNAALPAGSNVIGHVIADSGSTTAVTQATASNLNAQVIGNIAHDGADSGNPVKNGNKAIAYGTNPTGVSANDRTDAYANVAGIPFLLAGHPNVITRRDNYTGAQTDAAIITVSGGTKIVVLSCTVAADAANTVKPAVRIGFGAANTPTGAGTYLSHPGIPAGGGIREAGAVAGADGEDLRITCGAPTTGSLDVVTKYFTIEA